MIQAQQSTGGVTLRTTSATYTGTGKPATASDVNGNVTRYAYDALDRLATLADPEGRITTTSYDPRDGRSRVFNTAIQAGALL